MATLRELFEGEFDHTLRSHSEASFTMGGSSFRAIEKICWSFDEYSCFLGYFVEEEYATAGFLQALLAQADQSRNFSRWMSPVGVRRLSWRSPVWCSGLVG